MASSGRKSGFVVIGADFVLIAVDAGVAGAFAGGAPHETSAASENKRRAECEARAIIGAS